MGLRQFSWWFSISSSLFSTANLNWSFIQRNEGNQKRKQLATYDKSCLVAYFCYFTRTDYANYSNSLKGLCIILLNFFLKINIETITFHSSNFCFFALISAFDEQHLTFHRSECSAVLTARDFWDLFLLLLYNKTHLELLWRDFFIFKQTVGYIAWFGGLFFEYASSDHYESLFVYDFKYIGVDCFFSWVVSLSSFFEWTKYVGRFTLKTC